MKVHGVPVKQLFKDLNHGIREDNVMNGAAALAYYFFLAIFPGMIFLLSLIPYLPIPHLDQAIMDALGQALPGDAAKMFSGVVTEVVHNRKGGLLSFGFLFTLFSASSGMYAAMQQLNITYKVKEGRSFLKVRAIALGLTGLFALLMIVAFGLVVTGGIIQGWLQTRLGMGGALLTAFAISRWVIISTAILMAFAVTYYWGPDVEMKKFRFISPGSIIGAIILIAASLGFRIYVENFSNYSATYGSLGTVIILMLWLNVAGLVILLGSEINALLEHYSPEGKVKGEKQPLPDRKRAA